MQEWLPSINSWFPGSGITPWTVYDLEVSWWLAYKARVQAIAEQVKEVNRRGK